MRNYFLILLIIFLVIFESCFKELKTITEYKEYGMILEFDIILDQCEVTSNVNIDNYRDFSLLATFRKINNSDSIYEFIPPEVIVHDNFEVKNIKGENRSDLIATYDYCFFLDSGVPELSYLYPRESSMDTIDIAQHIYFFLSKQDTDTLLVRVKNHYFNELVFSNWDTVIIK